jgi:hypothetical protein
VTPGWLTTRNVIKLAVALHLLALLALPKDLWETSGLRPEDITGAALIGLSIVLAATTTVVVPRGPVPLVVAGYFVYFFAVAIARDAAFGYPQAFVFWFKELSYLCFGYLVWRAYRDAPWQFVQLALLLSALNLVLGLQQLVAGPRGLYGVAPFGHEQSPASAGMLYLCYAWLLFVACRLKPESKVYPAGLAVCGLLIIAAGSKIALLGGAAFFCWYLAQKSWRERSRTALVALAAFIAIGVAGVALATVLGYETESAWPGLGRYAGLLNPVAVMVERGIWWKIQWIDSWLSGVVGAGYAPSHLIEGEFSGYGMAMDNQVLFYLVTGGAVGIVLYGLLFTVIYRSLPPSTTPGMMTRSLVVAYLVMGLGGEVLQLSVSGNLFWMMLAVCFALDWSRAGLSDAGVRRERHAVAMHV